MAHGDDVVFLKIVFQSIDLLLPFHGAFQAAQGMGGVGFTALLHVKPEAHRPARGRGETVVHLLQPACHQGEQVGGFGKGIVPDGVVAPLAPRRLRKEPLLQAVAIGEQHWCLGPIGLDAHPEAAEHVGAIGMEGDAPEALGLALAGEEPIADIQPFQAGVRVGMNPHPGGEAKGFLGWGLEGEAALVEAIGLGRHPFPIHQQLQQIELHTPQGQGRPLFRGGQGIGFQIKGALHLRMGVEKPEREGGVGHQIGGRTVVRPSHSGHRRA